MSNIVSKIRQRIALKKSNKFDLSCDHITTSDFYKLAPVYFKEMVPGESINIKQTTFTRLSPMVKPMYGRCRIENRAFFVPMRTIMKGWNEFITETPVNNIFLQVPQIYPTDLTAAFSNSELSRDVTSDYEATENYRYDWKTSDISTRKYYRFTNVGKQAWTILQSLGYRCTLGLGSSFDIENNKMSALPLLAFFKIYKDWYKAQAYQTTVFDGIFDISVNIAQTSGRLTGAVLEPLLGLCGRVNYDKDYFSSAWDKPIAPNNGLVLSHDIKDVTNTSSFTSGSLNPALITNSPSDGGTGTTTPNISGTGSSGVWSSTSHPKITLYAIDALKALTDYLKRHQLAGGLAMDRMMSRFGMKPSDAALDRSVYLGKNTVDVLIADVMATGNGESTVEGVTNGSLLGEYAGKGVGIGSDGFSYKTDEYGYIMILSSIIPHIGYVQGMSRYVFHKDKLDFFTPEFDSLGVQAIARKELLSDYNQMSTSPSDDLVNGVFGFTSRYAEYKCSNDNLTGDFTCNSLNRGLDTWHLNRLFTPTSSTSNITHSFNFVRPSDSSQFARVFAYQGTDYDHFYNVHHFEIEDWAPMAQLFDDYDFDGGSKEVTIDVNGTQLN